MASASNIGAVERVAGALYGALIADALAMPAHWVYRTGLMPQLFGADGITGFRAPPERLPGSILSLSSTSGGGRGKDDGGLVGDVILHGKRKYWARGADYHYHVSLAAGEPTLEGQLLTVLAGCAAGDGSRSDSGQVEGLEAWAEDAASAGSGLAERFREAYVAFMTTPGSHNDTYAATAHRMFFANHVLDGVPAVEAADDDRHNVAAIDALTLPTLPMVLACVAAGGGGGGRAGDPGRVPEAAVEAGMAVLGVTRNVPYIRPYVAAYGQLLWLTLNGVAPSAAAASVACDEPFAGRFDLPAFAALHGPGREPMAACYIDGAFRVLLYLLYAYGDDADVSVALLANANAGGENVARGSCLGAVLGAWWTG
ncbi:ADP-ribosylglycohydrolase superfamily protein [Thecamonas trahens ATCC 50062]|uniref:ADP-ribosylglycohydrolase superfamily protein n=1 Tax=Thecamonas trahens ATCC 50062 TaxID=461836 RepID=A0A0L0DI60_THETB|nr:ADP-ribosylglycohydrolase superfamily protein [Thecamonas trahens ATCC 50062]KNC51925.1 ADP-ribosylglycohydrolase superfamily protein [Thecamonas trahens ATCC 50062]|eukprot:XP_013755521.1 ADP-ribosylglycohydrolase superfamily protein [Thecamonas trahens ATCC 50062]